VVDRGLQRAGTGQARDALAGPRFQVVAGPIQRSGGDVAPQLRFSAAAVVDLTASMSDRLDTAAVDDDNELVAELAQLALGQVAPDELMVFDETAQEYFSDPEAALSASGGDAAVGFGLELAMITPIALSVGTVVMQAIVDNLTGRAVNAGQTGLAALARRVFKRGNQQAELTLTHAQAQQVRSTAFERARSLGLQDAQAHLLADSFVGAIATAG
jgi:hypothetical protein